VRPARFLQNRAALLRTTGPSLTSRVRLAYSIWARIWPGATSAISGRATSWEPCGRSNRPEIRHGRSEARMQARLLRAGRRGLKSRGLARHGLRPARDRRRGHCERRPADRVERFTSEGLSRCSLRTSRPGVDAPSAKVEGAARPSTADVSGATAPRLSGKAREFRSTGLARVSPYPCVAAPSGRASLSSRSATPRKPASVLPDRTQSRTARCMGIGWCLLDARRRNRRRPARTFSRASARSRSRSLRGNRLHDFSGQDVLEFGAAPRIGARVPPSRCSIFFRPPGISSPAA